MIDAYKYLECSAKTNEGVREVFEHATRASLLDQKGGKKSKERKTGERTRTLRRFLGGLHPK